MFFYPPHCLATFPEVQAACWKRQRGCRISANAGDSAGTSLLLSFAMCSNIETDPLRQRQCVAVVDGIGRAPHVGLPCIRSRFASAAGFLLAAERAADFRAARADVDIGDAAIAADG